MSILYKISFTLGILMCAAAWAGGHLADALTRSQVADAVARASAAKIQYAEQRQEDRRALDAYDAASPGERLEALAAAGLMEDRTAQLIADPGALDEPPVGRAPAEVRDLANASQRRFAIAMR